MSRLRVFKLHGSTKWFMLKSDGERWEVERIGIPLDKDIWHTKDPNGEMQMPSHGLLISGLF